MTVWVLGNGSEYDWTIQAIFSSEEKAEAYLEEWRRVHPRTYRDAYGAIAVDLVEHEVDESFLCECTNCRRCRPKVQA
jgi:hypothetical protein